MSVIALGIHGIAYAVAGFALAWTFDRNVGRDFVTIDRVIHSVAMSVCGVTAILATLFGNPSLSHVANFGFWALGGGLLFAFLETRRLNRTYEQIFDHLAPAGFALD